jgi:hypothetical protein
LNLGEDFDRLMGGPGASRHEAEHQVAPSIAAANATDWSAVHNPDVLSPAEWNARNNAATGIQRAWRDFAAERKKIPEATRAMAASMGKPLTSVDEFLHHMKEGSIVVQANGDPGMPVRGHSVIYKDNLRYELLQIDPAMGHPSTSSRYGISKEIAQYVNTVNETHVIKPGTHSFIDTSFAFKAPEGMERLVAKGRMFALDPRYSTHFDAAYKAEVKSFIEAPYSYGIHYNCNTLVYGVVRRTRRLAAAFGPADS